MNVSTGAVTVINGAANAVVGNVTVGAGPYGVAFDPANGYLYVANYFSGMVSVISPSNATTGLPPSLAFFTVLIGVFVVFIGSAVLLGRHRSPVREERPASPSRQ
jgi:YVTN family beta-propeller protein